MSWPARAASGPSWPHPVMRPYTSFGFCLRHASGPRPSRSMTPGRKPSMSASARATSSSAAATPSFDLRSSVTERRPRSITSIQRSRLRPRSTDTGRSTSRTSAPMSASSIPANGPGPIASNSRTLVPESGPGMAAPILSARPRAQCRPSVHPQGGLDIAHHRHQARGDIVLELALFQDEGGHGAVEGHHLAVHGAAHRHADGVHLAPDLAQRHAKAAAADVLERLVDLRPVLAVHLRLLH